MEIGSYFLIEETQNETNDTFSFYLERVAKNKIYFDSGRSAIRFLCRKVEIKSVLLPDFLCDSMLQPFIEENFKIAFYEVDDNLEPVIESIKFNEPPGVFIHMDYFGKKCTENLLNTIVTLKNKGTIIIEDITHSIFSKKRQRIESDYYICSIRKWLGIPDGGILLSNQEMDFNEKSNNLELIENYVEASKIKKDKLFRETSSDSYLDFFKKAEKALDRSVETYRMSILSENILHTFNFEKMIKTRHENSKYLAKKISELGLKTLDFNFDSTIPIFVPVFFTNAQKRDFYKSHLINSKIYTPIHWPKPNFAGIKNNMYDIVLSIPCDHRYSINDMERIILELRKIMVIMND
jgi:hypothetical protein